MSAKQTTRYVLSGRLSLSLPTLLQSAQNHPLQHLRYFLNRKTALRPIPAIDPAIRPQNCEGRDGRIKRLKYTGSNSLSNNRLQRVNNLAFLSRDRLGMFSKEA